MIYNKQNGHIVISEHGTGLTRGEKVLLSGPDDGWIYLLDNLMIKLQKYVLILFPPPTVVLVGWRSED